MKITETITAFLDNLDKDPSIPFGTSVQELLDLCCKEFDLEIGIISKIVDNEYTVIKVSRPEDIKINPGDKFELDTTYCAIVCTTLQPVGFSDITFTEWSSHPAYKEFGLKAYFGAPIIIERQLFGTLNFSSPQDKKAIDSKEIIKALELMTKWIVKNLHENNDSKSICENICDLSVLCTKPLKWCQYSYSLQKTS